MSARRLVACLAVIACDAVSPDAAEDVPKDRSEVENVGAPRGMLPHGGPDGWTQPEPEPLAAIAAPLPAAYCDINVSGVKHATETDYLPHVIVCEDGGANFEALKAQAIAARSVAYYAMANAGQICDGQGCQVYSCAAQPSQVHFDAVQATAGQYLSYNGWLTYAFFVAGDSKSAPPSCNDVNNNTASSTEKWVTFNEGKTGYDVTQTELGFVFPEDKNSNGYGQNRGCMSQWGARCLENELGRDSTEILRFYYGADIEILQAQGGCVVPPNQAATGALDEVSCERIRGWAFDPDSGAAPIDAVIGFGEPPATSITLLADRSRDDLCGVLGSCEHGFESAVPRSLMDDLPHPVHAQAIDPQADAVTLPGSPKELNCAPPPLPAGVRRHISDPAVLESWLFDPFWQMARVDEATLTAIPEWKAVPAEPQLMRVEGDPAVWLLDAGFRRHVPDPATAAAWKLNLEAAALWSAAELEALPEGTPLRPEPFLVTGAGPAVYLLDDPQCPPGGDPGDPLCPVEEPGGESGGESSGGENPGTDGAPTPTEGGGEVGEAGEVGESGSGGEAGWGGGPALPPGYGETGCAVDPEGRGAPGLLVLVGLLLRRVSRRRQAPRRARA